LLATLPLRSGMASVRFEHVDSDRESPLPDPLTKRNAPPSETGR
jgi:hypothetical protein